MTHGIHGRCGRSVTWAENEAGRNLPPLVLVGYSLTVSGNVARRVPIYEVHACDEAEVADWERRRKEDQAELGSWQQSRARERQAGLSVACDHCGAVAQEPCINLSTQYRKSGERVPINHPHAARIVAGEFAEIVG